MEEVRTQAWGNLEGHRPEQRTARAKALQGWRTRGQHVLEAAREAWGTRKEPDLGSE